MSGCARSRGLSPTSFGSLVLATALPTADSNARALLESSRLASPLPTSQVVLAPSDRSLILLEAAERVSSAYAFDTCVGDWEAGSGQHIMTMWIR